MKTSLIKTLSWRSGGRYKVQLIDNTQNLEPQVATPTSCCVSLSHLMTYITELLRKLSVECIVVSFFKKQRKQFTNNQQHQQLRKEVTATHCLGLENKKQPMNDVGNILKRTLLIWEKIAGWQITETP